MRSTRATYAVERLKTRSGHTGYAAVSLSGGLFYLVDRNAGKDPESSSPANASSNTDTDAGSGVSAGAATGGAATKAAAPPAAAGSPARLCEPLPLDAFVAFVDGFGPPKPSKASKLDLAFEAQLRKSRS
jgi:hypothetical protein